MLKQAEAVAEKRRRREKDGESVKAQKCSSSGDDEQKGRRMNKQLPSKKNEGQHSLSFPMDVLLRIAAYISHRKSFNRFTASCKDLYEKSRDLVYPPFPSDKVLSRNHTYRSVYCFDLQFTPDSQNLLITEPNKSNSPAYVNRNMFGVQGWNCLLGFVNKKKKKFTHGWAVGDGCLISPRGNFLVSMKLQEVSRQSAILSVLPVPQDNGYRFDHKHRLWFTPTDRRGFTEEPIGWADFRFTPNEKILNVLYVTNYNGGRGLIVQWDLETWKLIRHHPVSMVFSIGCSNESIFWYSGTDQRVYQWHKSMDIPTLLPQTSTLPGMRMEYFDVNPRYPDILVIAEFNTFLAADDLADNVTRDTIKVGLVRLTKNEDTGFEQLERIDLQNPHVLTISKTYQNLPRETRDRHGFLLDWAPDGKHLLYGERKKVTVLTADLESGDITDTIDKETFCPVHALADKVNDHLDTLSPDHRLEGFSMASNGNSFAITYSNDVKTDHVTMIFTLG